MYVRRNIRLKHVLIESWGLLFLLLAWSFVVVFLHKMADFSWLVVPVLPVTLVGIAVSFFIGFKSVSAYNRWWEARQAVGT
jgi:putative membrane protein